MHSPRRASGSFAWFGHGTHHDLYVHDERHHLGAVTGKAVREHLLMIEISKAGKHGMLLEESRPWDATSKVWRCPRPSGIPKYLWALLEQKLRQIEPLPKAGPAAVPARTRRGLSSQEVTLSGLVPFPAFLAMELIEAHHPDLYRREFGFRA